MATTPQPEPTQAALARRQQQAISVGFWFIAFFEFSALGIVIIRAWKIFYIVVDGVALVVLYGSVIVFLWSFLPGRQTRPRPLVLDIVFLITTLFLIIFFFAALYRWAGLTGSQGITQNLWLSVYFSITTITTVGLGDFVPAHPNGRIIASAEALSGYFLLGFLAATMLDLIRNRA